MGSTRRSFSREFKEEAVRMITERGHSLAQVGRDLDIRPNPLLDPRDLDTLNETPYP